MVGFFIDLNGKTNHKLPVYGIRKGRKIRKSTVQWIYAAFEFQVLPWMIPWAGWCKLASRSLHSQGVLG